MDLNLKELGQFRGTTNYFYNPLVPWIKYTDGVQYVVANGYLWLFFEIVGGIKKLVSKGIRGLIAIDFSRENSEGSLKFIDGNENVLLEKTILFTDAKKDLKFYFIDNILMLSREY